MILERTAWRWRFTAGGFLCLLLPVACALPPARRLRPKRLSGQSPFAALTWCR
ncbi:MAG TPA: hypothetical protein VGX68_24035 [Thermoanaerobaculia bacterium]|nr:hypothetical protein [Thermoanaerobaculia bacterium]